MSKQPRTGTILVVDDQESVRGMLLRQLAAAGHVVLEASDGSEALEMVRARSGRVDVVLSDVVMPRMNGTELADNVLRTWPKICVVLMSAYAPAGLARVGVGGAIVPVLQKPFDQLQLLDLIQVALEQAASQPGHPPAAPSTQLA